MILEFIGQPPAIEGKRCQGLICQGYEFNRELLATASVTYLKFEGVWHRVCFDPGTVHWRTCPTAPEPSAVPEEGWNYPQADVGLAAGLIGVRLTSYTTATTERGISVVFIFENGRQLLIDNVDDCTNYQLLWNDATRLHAPFIGLVPAQVKPAPPPLPTPADLGGGALKLTLSRLVLQGRPATRQVERPLFTQRRLGTVRIDTDGKRRGAQRGVHRA